MSKKHGGFWSGKGHGHHEHDYFGGHHHGKHGIVLGTQGDDRGDDSLDGTEKNDFIIGLKGDDELFGKGGNDSLKGGKGNDLLDGGAGKDKLDGGKGDDELFGREGNDKLDGGKGNDLLDGGAGHDKLKGGKGDDELFGGDGNDRLDGGKGNDELFGGEGNDKLDGGKGNDLLDGGAGSDKLNGGKGDDIAVYSSAENTGADACGRETRDFYDGGKGTDVLRLILTADELASDAVKEDLDNFREFLSDNADAGSSRGPVFEFQSFNLAVRNFEALEVPQSNATPVGFDDEYSTSRDMPLDVSASEGVLANDTDADGQPLALTAVLVGTGPAHAQDFDLYADGSFSYTPIAGYIGDDSFSYQASDGQDLSDVTMVDLLVTPPAPPPPPGFDADGLFA